MSEAEVRCWRVNSESISLERLDGETILINFDSGQYFSFLGTSADILWLIDSGVDRRHWPGILEGRFPGLAFDSETALQIDEFLRELVAVGVIFAAEGDGGGPVELPDDYSRTAWTRPMVEANDDLADLLVIDPIHDTTDDGWPQTRPD